MPDIFLGAKQDFACIRNKRSWATLWFGLALIIPAWFQFPFFSNYDYYHFMFQQMPSWSVDARYAGSLLFRVLHIWAGFGLLLVRPYGRRFAIGLAVYTLLTIVWRHPFATFQNIAIFSEYKGMAHALPFGTVFQGSLPIFPTDLGNYHLTYPWLPLISMAVFMTIDLVFYGGLLYYLTKPGVKKQFE